MKYNTANRGVGWSRGWEGASSVLTGRNITAVTKKEKAEAMINILLRCIVLLRGRLQTDSTQRWNMLQYVNLISIFHYFVAVIIPPCTAFLFTFPLLFGIASNVANKMPFTCSQAFLCSFPHNLVLISIALIPRKKTKQNNFPPSHTVISEVAIFILQQTGSG